MQSEEAALSPEQKQQLAQLKQQQQQQRKLLQGGKTQAQIQEIHDIDQVNDAPPYPYDSWTGVHGKQTASEAHAQVQSEEAALSPEQKQQLAQLKQQQQQQQRKLLQATNTDMAQASEGSGAVNPQHLQAIHNRNSNYEAQKQQVEAACQKQNQADQAALAAATSSEAIAAASQQLQTDQNNCQQELLNLKSQTISQNMNAQAWVGNVDWAAVPWPSQQGQ